MLKGAWVQRKQRSAGGKTWSLGTRKNALARGCHHRPVWAQKAALSENCPLYISAPSTLKCGKNSTGFTGLL